MPKKYTLSLESETVKDIHPGPKTRARKPQRPVKETHFDPETRAQSDSKTMQKTIQSLNRRSSQSVQGFKFDQSLSPVKSLPPKNAYINPIYRWNSSNNKNPWMTFGWKPFAAKQQTGASEKSSWAANTERREQHCNTSVRGNSPLTEQSCFIPPLLSQGLEPKQLSRRSPFLLEQSWNTGEATPLDTGLWAVVLTLACGIPWLLSSSTTFQLICVKLSILWTPSSRIPVAS